MFLAIVLADFEFRIMTKTITNLEVLGIFLWELAADVESNMIKAISSGTPPVFTSRFRYDLHMYITLYVTGRRYNIDSDKIGFDLCFSKNFLRS